MATFPDYKNRIVAFVDILGFKSLVSSLGAEPDLHSKLYDALSQIRNYKKLSRDKSVLFSDIEVSTFSDSIVISAKEENIFHIIRTCGWLQANLLKSGILIRGGISSGLTIHENGILYGEGMINAYHLESKCAIYPRILLDPALLKTLNPNITKFCLTQDLDGLWFVDFFKFYAFTNIGDDAIADGYDPREIYFSEMKECIETTLQTEERINVISKWKWLQNKLQDAMGFDPSRAFLSHLGNDSELI